jgi:3-keto-5-aminohexanoate cleavage enzyme
VQSGRSVAADGTAASPPRVQYDTDMDPLVISVGLTGSRITKDQTPAIPITPREIAESGVAAWRAGAAVLHVHVRDPRTGLGTQDAALFRDVVDRLRADTDAILCLTTSGIPGRNLTIEERLAPLALQPDMVSFDAGSVNTPAGVFLNPPEFLDALAAAALGRGVKLELECFEAGHVATCRDYLAAGRIAPRPHFQFVLGTAYGMPADAGSLVYLTSLLPAGSTWSVIGIGRAQTPMAMIAMAMGGHARVGLEDNIYYEKGVLAESNAQLVERVVRLAGEMGRPVATAAQARRLLGLD